MERKGTIKIIEQSCGGCPAIFEVNLPDQSDGFVRFRYGYISLVYEESRNEIVGDQISDGWDGVISLKEVIDWLIKKGYDVNCQIE